jgi:hypothetical protein
VYSGTKMGSNYWWGGNFRGAQNLSHGEENVKHLEERVSTAYLKNWKLFNTAVRQRQNDQNLLRDWGP